MRKLIAWKELKTLVPYSRQHLARLEEVNKFPQRVRLGQARTAWVMDEIETWIEQRISEREVPTMTPPA